MVSPLDKNTEIVWAHTLDYDLYLEEKRKRHSIIRPVAVFLDEYSPFHPDAIIMGSKVPLAPEKYYPALDNFFTRVENKLNLTVVIAAYPCSHYDDLPDYFKGRKWIRGQTIKLVKESQLVLAHNSTSLNFANLYYKPVIFLTSLEMDKSYNGPFIRKMASWFGKSPIFMDVDDNINWEFELTVSKKHYDNYRQAYIKKEDSEDLPFWQIVANKLKELK